MTRVADSSALYALFDEDDEHHRSAREALANPEPIVVPTEVLTETVDLVEYRSTWGAASRALGWLLDRPNIQVAHPIHVPAVQGVYESAGGELSLTDAFVVQTCRVLGAEALAYDGAILEHVG